MLNTANKRDSKSKRLYASKLKCVRISTKIYLDPPLKVVTELILINYLFFKLSSETEVEMSLLVEE